MHNGVSTGVALGVSAAVGTDDGAASVLPDGELAPGEGAEAVGDPGELAGPHAPNKAPSPKTAATDSALPARHGRVDWLL